VIRRKLGNTPQRIEHFIISPFNARHSRTNYDVVLHTGAVHP
jgi:hypothetical protein